MWVFHISIKWGFCKAYPKPFCVIRTTASTSVTRITPAATVVTGIATAVTRVTVVTHTAAAAALFFLAILCRRPTA